MDPTNFICISYVYSICTHYSFHPLANLHPVRTTHHSPFRYHSSFQPSKSRTPDLFIVRSTHFAYSSHFLSLSLSPGCTDQFTHTIINFCTRPVKNMPPTPALANLQDITFSRPRLKQRILINCVKSKSANQPN